MVARKLFSILGLCLLVGSLTACTNTDGSDSPEDNSKEITWLKEPSETFQSAPIALYEKGFLVQKNDLYGFIDEQGKQLLPYEYSLIQCFGEDAYGVENKPIPTYLSQLLDVEGYDSGCWTGVVGQQTYIWYSTKSNQILESIYNIETNDYDTSEVIDVSSKINTLREKNTGSFLPVDITFQGQDLPTNKGYVFMNSNDKRIDKKNLVLYDDIRLKKNVYNPMHTFLGIAAVKQGKHWAAMDDNGKLVTEFIYEEAEVLNKEYAKFKKANDMVLIGRDGHSKIFQGLDDISAPIHGIVYAKQGDLWGTIKL